MLDELVLGWPEQNDDEEAGFLPNYLDGGGWPSLSHHALKTSTSSRHHPNLPGSATHHLSPPLNPSLTYFLNDPPSNK